MGQRRDNGTGKQFGSHVDYVVEGALPSGSLSVFQSAPTAVATCDVVIRPSRYLTKITVRPGGGSDGFDDIDADAVLFPMLAGWAPESCTRSKGGSRTKLPVFDTAEGYLLEVPPDVRKIAAWYILWLDRGKRVRELPDGFLRMLSPLRYEYFVIGRLCDIAEKARRTRMRDDALERLEEYGKDDRLPARQSAVAAAGKILEHLDRRDEMEGNMGSSGHGGGFTLAVNIAAMIGGGETKVVSEVVDAGQQQAD